MVNADEIRTQVDAAAQAAGGIGTLAAKWGLTYQYVSDVVRGRRDPGKSILAALGYERVVLYRKIDKQ